MPLGWSVSTLLSQEAGGWGTPGLLGICFPTWLSWRDSSQRDLCGACVAPKLAGDLVSGGI